MIENQFLNIIQLIKQSRNNAIKAVNTELINLYWNIGEFISKKVENANWGEKTVEELANFIQKNHPELKGFNRRGLYRMKQFYEMYNSLAFVSTVSAQLQKLENQKDIIVSTVSAQLDSTAIELSDIRKTILTKISWSHHKIIFSRCKIPEEMEFYIRLTIKEKYSSRDLERQINSSVFERTMLGNSKRSPTQISPILQEIQTNLTNSFKDSYVFEFLNLPESHSESDLQKGLIKQMKNFILELGKDFLFIGEEFKIQVGNSDFYIDLLFYHRNLQCLVVFELKTDKFKPEHLGQLNFYLEALDRDVKNQNENPSIGILLCKDKDHEVVEYALNRSLSAAMVSEYKTQLPDKRILQQKLHELFLENDL